MSTMRGPGRTKIGRKNRGSGVSRCPNSVGRTHGRSRIGEVDWTDTGMMRPVTELPAHTSENRPSELSERTDPRSPRTFVDWAVASFAIAAIALHDAVHVTEGRYWDVLWICNMAALLVGPAILLRSPLLSAAALTWLVPGTVVWLADSIITGSNILPTSYAIHLGGTAAAFYATRVSGFARRGWLAALALLIGCVVASNLFLPSTTNVNAAHSIPKGWSFLGGGRVTFALKATMLSLAACALGRVVGKSVAKRRSQPAPS